MAINVDAPMVGKILRVEKKVGDRVEEDEVVVVMEAPANGVLKELKVTPGQAVEAEQVLAVIE